MLGAALWALGGRAAAQSSALPRVRVAVDACVPVDGAETARLAAMELHAAQAPADDAGPVAATVTVRCEGDRVVIRVEDAATGKTLERAVRRADLPTRGAARLLALAVSELVFASWAELSEPPPALPPADPPPPPVVETARAAAEVHRTETDATAATSTAPSAPAVPTPAPPPPRPSRAPAPRAEAALAFVTRDLPDAPGGVAWLGGRGELSLRVGRWAVGSLDLGVSGASTRGDLGTIQAWLPEAGLLVGGRARWGVFALEARVGFRAGVAVYRGIPAAPLLTRGGSAAALWGGPCLDLAARVSLGRGVSVFAAVEAGYTLFDSLANARIVEAGSMIVDPATPSLGLSGPWLGLSAGVAYRP